VFSDVPQGETSGGFSIISEAQGAGFGFFTPDEIRKLSVKQLKYGTSFDAFGHPIEGGLYDLALGPTSREQGSCRTCGLSNGQCPGHVGHIELAVPVYNPIVFPTMFKVLGLMCFSCHGFRCKKLKTRLFRIKLLLLEANMYKEASGLEDEIAQKGVFAKDSSSKAKYAERLESILFKREAEAMKVLNAAVVEDASQSNYSKRQGRRPNVQMHMHCRTLWRETVKEFLKAAQAAKKCDSCGANPYRLKKDGYAKIFRVAGKDTTKTTSNHKLVGMSLADGSDNEDDEFGDQLRDDLNELEPDKVFMSPAEVQERFQKLWRRELPIVSRLWGRKRGENNPKGYLVFFLQTLMVPASRFRPPAVMGSMTFDHAQNQNLQKVLENSDKIRDNLGGLGDGENGDESSDEEEDNEKVLEDRKEKWASVMNIWVDLQSAVNTYLDSSKSSDREPVPGVRQGLEKKEGLFRQNMMGKRVNYAARSVISPDPYIATDEVGLPVRFAKKLSYPEPVTSWNAEELAQMVRNGAEKHPGAAFVEDEDGKMIDLSNLNDRQRNDIATSIMDVHAIRLIEGRRARASRFVPGEENELYQREHNKQLAPLSLRKQKKVWRHVRSGDVMLANRQPTLHKPSLMAHKVRVIDNEDMQTIRLHYANCNSYNADFDGDEINLHLPQGELCRAEAYEVAYTNHQYLSATNGEPLRGLIQDHVGMGVMLTKQNTFLNKEEYTQMLFAACGAMKSRSAEIKLVEPAILLPKRMWTGKQVITTILMHLVGTQVPEELLTMGPRKTKIPAVAWKIYPERKTNPLIGDEAGPLGQCQVVVRQGVLCTGVLDKAQFGATEYGLVHSIYELYGPNAAGELLSAFGRLFTYCSQKWGHTCAIEDLILNPEAENFRTNEISKSVATGVATSAKFSGLNTKKRSYTNEEVAKALEARIRSSGENDEALLDSTMQGVTSKVTSAIIKECLPKGQRKPFPSNCFSLMIYSGAKGSLVNHSQVSCGLGQQALEGRRVPRTISGKSLPCFSAFDPTPRAGGFVSDRFLTGVRPQEYYFHCMAGREGLIDTAVKTARSGYLQRCLVKHLESLYIGYDRTVRQSDGSALQFTYGGDGLDALHTKFLDGEKSTLGFLYNNVPALAQKLRVGNQPGQLNLSEPDPKTGIDTMKARSWNKSIRRAKERSKGANIALFKGGVVSARKPKRISEFNSNRASNKRIDEKTLLPGLFQARIVKTYKEDGAVDLKYSADGALVKRMPVNIQRVQDGKSTSIQIVFGALPDPVMSHLDPDRFLGSISEALESKVETYIKKNPDGLLKSEDDSLTLRQLVWVKYLRSLCAPGENVGVIAAQSIGEPSTQMTLNTFHLAGHGAGNVTLGIPRLRELLMTASESIKTPSMTMPLLDSVSREQAERIKGSMYRLRVNELLRAKEGIKVTEVMCRRSARNGELSTGRKAAQLSKKENGSGQWFREYVIELNLQPLVAIEKEFGLSLGEIESAIGLKYCPALMAYVAGELRRGDKSRSIASIIQTGKMSEDSEDEENESNSDKNRKKKEDDDDMEEDDVDDAAEENGELRLGKKKEVEGYDDESDAEASEAESDDGDVEMKEGDEDGATGPVNKIEVGASASRFGCFVSCTGRPESKGKSATVKIVLRFEANMRKILMVGIAEAAAKTAIVRDTKGIEASYIIEGKGEDNTVSIQTDGCNFEAAWNLADKIEVNRLKANDVGAFLRTYGVEAARGAIVREVKGVFGAYGIGVDPRHLGLVADYMTFEGGYRPLNRIGMSSNTSPFVRMTFETSTQFLTASALEGEEDALVSASSRLCVGQLMRTGTGAFDLLVPNPMKSMDEATKKKTQTFKLNTKKKH